MKKEKTPRHKGKGRRSGQRNWPAVKTSHWIGLLPVQSKSGTGQSSLLTQAGIGAGCSSAKIDPSSPRFHLIPARQGATPRQTWLEPGHPASDDSSDIRHRSRLPDFRLRPASAW